VFYEVGIAHALDKQVLLMTQSIDDFSSSARLRVLAAWLQEARKVYDNVQNMLTHRHEA